MVSKNQSLILGICCFATVLFFLGQPLYLFYLSIIYYIFYLIEFIRFKNLNVIYLAHVFISTYFIVGLVVFNVYEFRALFLYNIDESLFNTHNLSKINYCYLISLSLLKWYYRPSYLRTINTMEMSCCSVTNNTYARIVGIWAITYLICLSFIYFYLDGRYIWFIQDAKGSYELQVVWRVISSGGLYLSALLPLYRFNTPCAQGKIFYLAVFSASFILLLLGIRMYAVLLVFSVILNAQLRGYRYQGRSLYLFYIILGLFFLSFAIFRFQTFDYSNSFALLQTIFGEFIYPHSSAFYIIINPLSFNFWPYSLQDLLFQILPFGLNDEFTPLLEGYTSFLFSNGLVAGYGGYFLLGQLYFYFGFLYFIPILIFSKFFCYADKALDKKKKPYFLTVFPIFLLVLPRMEIWTLQALFYNFVFVLTVIAISKKPNRIDWKIK